MIIDKEIQNLFQAEQNRTATKEGFHFHENERQYHGRYIDYDYR